MRLLRSGEVRPLNEAKLLLIGQGSVGKTSLIERLIRDKYDKNQPQTDGLNVQTWKVQVNNKYIRLNSRTNANHQHYAPNCCPIPTRYPRRHYH
ncbi:hypothetical protein [Nostoc sp.]|uniref:hypothetical protein n=1 Tax=Nostoc sp. TaxID=1180 RepID=UPI002FF58E96